MRLIDADEMQKYINEHNTAEEWCISQYSADWIYSFIENRPTIDIEDVNTIVAEEVLKVIYELQHTKDHYIREALYKLKNKYTKEGVE